MTTEEFIRQVHITYMGRSADEAPRSGEAKHRHYIDVGNQKLDEWARDPDNRWQSLYGSKTIDIQDEAFDVALPDDVLDIVGGITLLHAGVRTSVDLVPLDRLHSEGQGAKCAIEGAYPQVLKFNIIIPANSQITFKGYMHPPVIGSSTKIRIENPRWLVLATAAELSRSDPAKDDQFANLIGMANDLYVRMARQNKRGRSGGTRKVRSRFPSLGGV